MKKARKLLVALIALVMLLGTCLTVSASGTDSVKTSAKSITAKNQTIYTNGKEDGRAEIDITYTWAHEDAKGNKFSGISGIKAASDNRGVVRVVEVNEDKTTSTSKGKNTTTTGTKLILQAVSNGKAKITLTDKMNPKVKKVITVTVKTWADDIAFSNDKMVEVKDNEWTLAVANAKGTTVNLGASITTAAASDVKLKYALVDKTVKTGITVDAKGNVKVSKLDAADTRIMVYPNDVAKEVANGGTPKDSKVKVQYITIKAGEKEANQITLVQDTTTTKDARGLLNKKNVLVMKNNRGDQAKTYALNWTGDVEVKDLVFASNKPAVASVDANGVITAQGNGTAKITITPKVGNKWKAVSLTVKVTTDVEYVAVAAKEFTLLADGKNSVNIGGETNADASNKKVKYEIKSVTDASGKLVTGDTPQKLKAAMAKYLTVSAKGVAKAKQPFSEARVTVFAVGDTTKTSEVTLSATVAANKVKIDVVKNTSKTIYVTGKVDDPESMIELKATATDKNNNAINDAQFNWTSSNSNIARVNANGVVTAYGNGSATITATAADGSGKKATYKVTSVVDAYKITTKNGLKDGDTIVLKEDAAQAAKGKETSFALANLFGAATNSDAKNKKVTYTYVADGRSAATVKLTAGKEEKVKIAPADGRTKDSAAITVTLKCEAASTFDKAELTITNNGVATNSSFTMKKGESLNLAAGVKRAGASETENAGMVVSWDSKNKSIATVDKNGKIVAKSPGMTEITAYTGKKLSEAEMKSNTITVYVGRDDASVKKDLIKAVETQMKAENREYTGIKTVFDKKNVGFNLEIVKPGQDFTNLKYTGLVELLNELLNSGVSGTKPSTGIKFTGLEVVDSEGTTWELKGQNGKAVVTNGEKSEEFSTPQEAISAVLAKVVGDKKTLKEWNGQTTSLKLNGKEEVTGGGTCTYSFDLGISTWMSQSNYEASIDADVDSRIAELNAELNAALGGKMEVSYNASTNVMDLVIKDSTAGIEDLEEKMAEYKVKFVPVVKAMFGDAVEVTIDANQGEKNEIRTKKRDGELTDEFISDYIDGLFETLKNDYGAKTAEDLDGAVIASNASYVVGTQSYNAKYSAYITVDASVYKAAADKRISDALAGKSFDFGGVNYADNKLTVNINKTYADKAPADLTGEGLKSILASLVGSENAVEAVVVTGEGKTAKSTRVDLKDGKTADDHANAIIGALMTNVGKLSELDDTTATIRVICESVNGESRKTLLYTISYDVEGVNSGTTTQSVDEVEVTTEETVEESTEEVTEETTTEESTDEAVEESTEEVTDETTTEEVVEESTEEVADETVAEEATTEEAVVESTEEVAEEATAEEVVVEEAVEQTETEVESAEEDTTVVDEAA